MKSQLGCLHQRSLNSLSARRQYGIVLCDGTSYIPNTRRTIKQSIASAFSQLVPNRPIAIASADGEAGIVVVDDAACGDQLMLGGRTTMTLSGDAITLSASDVSRKSYAAAAAADC